MIQLKQSRHLSQQMVIFVIAVFNSYSGSCLQLPSKKNPQYEGDSSFSLFSSRVPPSHFLISEMCFDFSARSMLICKFSQTDILFEKAMQVRPDDVWIITPPKCGTTWTQVLNE